MIPVIYSPEENRYRSEGLGRITDTIKGSVKEKLNGSYELSFTYPADGHNAGLIKEFNQILIKASDKDLNGQPFRIYRVTEDAKTKRLRVYARHKTYDASGIPVAPFTAMGILPALTGLVTNSLETNPFTVWTDIENTSTEYSQRIPLSFRECLGGVEGSILDRFGGEFEWDVNTIKLHAHRGSDTGVTIQYKKNLTGFEIDRSNESAAYTGCLAYWQSEDTVIVGNIQKISNPEDFPVQKIFKLDCSNESDTEPDVAWLDARSQAYMAANNFGVPFKDNLKVTFAPLWKTTQYANKAALERIDLGDWVTVTYKEYALKMQTVEREYDYINEIPIGFTLGNKKASLSSKVADIARDTQGDVVNEARSMMEEALEHAAEVMSGGTGGYIYISRNADGQPNEIYILDSPDINTAVNILRMNYAGIAFSQSGINGQFTTAWTIDSHFVADFITVGELNGNLIRAHSILTNALEVAVSTLVDNIQLNFSFLSDGLHIARKDGNTIVGAYQTIISDLGMRVIQTSSNYPVIVAEQDTVTAVNLTADNYLRIRAQSVSSRFQQFYSTPHHENEFGVFWEIV